MQVLQSKEISEKEFYDSVYAISHSDKTVQTYRTSINHLRKFLHKRFQFDELVLVQKIQTEELDVYQFLSQFIIHIDKLGVNAKGIRSYLSGVKGYLRHLGVRINSDDYKQFVRVPKIIRTYERPLDKEILIRVLHNVPPKLQAAILVATSSGLRVGELVQLKISDIDFNSTPTKIIVRGSIAKGKQTRETFITQEATNVLNDYLKSNFGWDDQKPTQFQDTFIFGKTTNKGKKPKNPQHNPSGAKINLQTSLLYFLRKIPDLQIKNENGYHSIHFHGFRKFFRTMVGNSCGRDFAEALMGHGFYMDTYYQLPDEKKREMYLNAEPNLTISDSKSIETNFKKLSNKYNALETKVDELLQYLRTNSVEIPDFLTNTKA